MAQKITLNTLEAYKASGSPFAVLTCYDYAFASLLSRAGIEVFLVGDSLGQTVLGHRTTLPVTLEITIALAAAVRRGAPDAYIIVDMPFMSYQVSESAAIASAGRLMQDTGADAVKMEVNAAQSHLVSAVATAGIPVVAHIGYRPQSAGCHSKMVATRQAQHARQLLYDAELMIQSGAVMLLLETVTTPARPPR